MSEGTFRCRYPSVEPSKANPGGDCREVAVAATYRGNGTVLPLCGRHAERFRRAVPIDEVVVE